MITRRKRLHDWRDSAGLDEAHEHSFDMLTSRCACGAEYTERKIFGTVESIEPDGKAWVCIGGRADVAAAERAAHPLRFATPTIAPEERERLLEQLDQLQLWVKHGEA